MIIFNGCYGPLLEEYLTFKKSLGYSMANRYHWRDIDNFLQDHTASSKTIGINEYQFDEWYKLRPNETSRNQYERAIRMKRFSCFLLAKGYKSFIPVNIKTYKKEFVPYVFSTEEISKLFKAADSMKSKHSNGSKELASIIFRLLYSTGLRISELLSLELEHLKLYEEIPHLIITNTKNKQNRLVVLSNSGLIILQTFLGQRSSGQSNFVFITNKGSSISSGLVYEWFREVLEIAGIHHRGRNYGPCVHSIRHSFAVHSLYSMSKKGLDLYYCLPILSNFLGHKNIESTDMYVRLTAEIYPDLLSKMSKINKLIVPEVLNEKYN